MKIVHNRSQSRHQTYPSTNAQIFEHECLVRLSWNLSKKIFSLSCSLPLKHFLFPFLTLRYLEDQTYEYLLKNKTAGALLLLLMHCCIITVAVNCPKYSQVPLMVSVSMSELICSFMLLLSLSFLLLWTRISLRDACISKSVTLNDFSSPFQKFSQDSFATKWIIVC